MRILYSAILTLCFPLVLLHLGIRALRNRAYRDRWWQRFGFSQLTHERPVIWIHAVSVGETQAAVPLIKQLLKRYPNHDLLVTSTTPTGAAQIEKSLGRSVQHHYLPYDFSGPTKRFVRRVSANILIVIETELWPNLFYHCAQANIPIVVANARLSDNSLRGYQRVRRLIVPTLRHVSLIACQYKADVDRFEQLGVAAHRLRLVGNIKYDLQPPNELDSDRDNFVERAALGDRPIWVAASTHEGEDEQMLAAHQRLLGQFPNALLILVPRHPERFASVTNRAQSTGFDTATRSASPFGTSSMTVFIGDTMGELMLWYAVADIAFVGGSLVPTGGHNLLEPLSLGKPVLFGPHMFNFETLKEDVLSINAGVQVTNSDDLASSLINLLNTEEERTKMGENGLALFEHNAGATDSLVALIDTVIEQKNKGVVT